MTDPACGRCNDQAKRPGQGIIDGCPVHDVCPDCGKPADSFACKVRHVGISIGWGRAANE